MGAPGSLNRDFWIFWISGDVYNGTHRHSPSYEGHLTKRESFTALLAGPRQSNFDIRYWLHLYTISHPNISELSCKMPMI